MYLIKNVASDPRKVEMCFDCSAFQYQLATVRLVSSQPHSRLLV